MSCGIGERVRQRKVTQEPSKGGQVCPPLKEKSWCGSARKRWKIWNFQRKSLFEWKAPCICLRTRCKTIICYGSWPITGQKDLIFISFVRDCHPGYFDWWFIRMSELMSDGNSNISNINIINIYQYYMQGFIKRSRTWFDSLRYDDTSHWIMKHDGH